MEIVSPLNLEALGVSGVTVAILLYQNWQLRKDLSDAVRREQEEREYSRELSKSYRESGLKTIETMGRLEQAFMLLKDGLK